MDLVEFGDIEEDRWKTFYQEVSPIHQGDRIDVPVLFWHGINDPMVNILETETMVKALRANGVDAPSASHVAALDVLTTATR